METIDINELATRLGAGAYTPSSFFKVDLDGLHNLDAAKIDEIAVLLNHESVPVLIGVSNEPVAASGRRLIDALTFTVAPEAPGRSWVDGGPGALDDLEETVSRAPVAAAVLARILRIGASLDVNSALELESAAYSMLLGSDEFRRWRASVPDRSAPDDDEAVLVQREGDILHVTLNRPERHNAFGRAMRDQLIDALAIARLDDTVSAVHLSGRGPSFCSGGDLDEFGTAGSPAEAHLVRMHQSAGLAVHRLARRVHVTVHGSCIGAGIEIPAFACRVVAREGARFRLPEIGMGLIPGAGGTVSIPRRIGRWRTAYMALTGRTIDVDVALAWGLVDGRA